MTLFALRFLDIKRMLAVAAAAIVTLPLLAGTAAA
jgi:hypothetical protein